MEVPKKPPKKVEFRKIGVAIAVVVAFLVGLALGPMVRPAPAPGKAVAEEMWKDLKARGKIVVGSSPDWPPFEFIDETGEYTGVEGKYTGFEVELLETIAGELGLTVEWKKMGFETIIPSVKAKQIDIGVSGFSVTPERLEVIQYMIPHSITEGQIVMLKSRAEELGITTIESLSNLPDLGLVCGTQIGTTQSSELTELAPESLRTYDDFELALEALYAGYVDCVYSETPITSWWIMQSEKAGKEPLVIVFKRSYWPVAFIANQDNDILVSKINGILAKLISTGKVDELKEKWRCA